MLQKRPVELLEDSLGGNWINLQKARERGLAEKERLTAAFKDLHMEDTSTVVFGSIARDDVTSGSDIDWTLLIDGLANPRHLDTALEIENALRNLGVKPPGQEGTFGGLAFSHDIIHNIGGEDDTNKNTTQRVLLLLESSPVGLRDAYDRVIRQVLNRYIIEDWGWIYDKVKVPRFLLNDIVRYWRTIAVDFGYKRKQRQGKGWALRTIKLRMSRKLTYASGLLACFSCYLDPHLQNEIKDTTTRDSNRTHPVVLYLSKLMGQTPIDIFSNTILMYDKTKPEILYKSAKKVIDSYDQFISLIDNEETRNHLEYLEPAKAENDRIYQNAREISCSFQEGLNGVFLEENGTDLFSLTKTYGVF
jgi:predicted nucleotidyltransferase